MSLQFTAKKVVCSMHLKQALRYLMRMYRRWKYLRTPRPVFEPTVEPVERQWTATDEKLERALYVANPNAFWLRPDRHEHKVPCWQIEGVWEDGTPHSTDEWHGSFQRAPILQQTYAPRNPPTLVEEFPFAVYNYTDNKTVIIDTVGPVLAQVSSGYAQKQNAALYAAMAQHRCQSQLGNLQNNSLPSLSGLGGSLANLLGPLNQRN